MKIKTTTNTMKRSILRYVSGWMSVAVFAVVGLFGLSAAVNAWGPSDRKTFTTQNPASYVTFNSMTNNPAYGDERNFFRIKDASQNSSTYTDDLKIQPGKTYEGYVYIHNNASKTFNSAEYKQKGIALNTKLRINLPKHVAPGSKARINAYISADNAQPKQVWDEAYMTSDSNITLRYVPGSAIFTNRGKTNGSKLNDSFLTSGALLGYDKMDGRFPGCNEYAGYVKFRFTADQPNFTFKKQVAKDTEKAEWGESVTAKPGEKVKFLLSYKNTGTTQQNNVILRDMLPSGMKYVNGSTMVANSVSPKGAKGKDGITTATGINYGSYAPKGTFFVQLSATVPGKEALKCGRNVLKNTASASTANGSKNGSATVVVEVECKPKECKPGIPEGDERCEDTPPVVPDELPTTGPAQIVAGILGVVLVALGVAYWIRSRGEYKKALAGFTEDFTEEPKERLLEAKTDTEKNHANKFHR